MIVPDANLLLYAYNRADPNHRKALNWWSGLVEGTEPVGLPCLVTVGFLRLATGSAAFEQPLPSAMATLTVEEWLDQPHIDVLNPGPAHMRIWGDLIRATNASGNLVNDAHIAAIAIEHDAEVHTNDRDFARFPGLRWSNPLQTLA